MRAGRHIRHFVEIDHPAIGLFQEARLNATILAFATEENLFHPVGLDRGATNAHKWPVSAIGVGVNIARGQFLATPRRAGQHHPPVRLGHLVKLPDKRAESRAFAQHVRRRRVTPLQLGIFPAQATGFHTAADHHHQLINVEGLFDEIIRPLLDRRDRDLDIAVARDNHHRHFRVIAF